LWLAAIEAPDANRVALGALAGGYGWNGWCRAKVSGKARVKNLVKIAMTPWSPLRLRMAPRNPCSGLSRARPGPGAQIGD